MSLKNNLFTVAKMCGFFNLAEYLTKNDLPILCYHGFSFNDEHLFRPKLFQSAELFAQRMRWLKNEKYQTITLDEALQRMRDGKLGRKDIVITIDDGFYSVAAIAAPILKDLGFTATIYVTTYYVENNNPIYRICLQYIFWKTTRDPEILNDVLPDQQYPANTNKTGAERILWNLIEFGEAQLSEHERMALARKVADKLEVDFDELLTTRRLTLMNKQELAALAGQGFDIQLHTHRHRLPENNIAIKRELFDNRAVLEPITKRPLTHLCYPSGEWSPNSWPALEAEQIKTATTCEPGLNSLKTPPYAMSRFLDFETTPQIIFEAELCGFSHLLRQTLGKGLSL